MSVVALWSMKGGVGVSVVTAGLAVAASRGDQEAETSTIAVDLVGDLPVVLGISPVETLGVVDWLHASPDDPVDALRRLTIWPGDSPDQGFGIMLRGVEQVAVSDVAAAAVRLVDALRSTASMALIDCGQLRRPGPILDAGSGAGIDQQFRLAVAASADVGWLVSRACYLSARVAAHSPIEPDGCVVLREAGRTLTSADVSHSLGVPLVLDVAIDPRVARVVDCGLMLTRLPASLQRTMARSLRHVA